MKLDNFWHYKIIYPVSFNETRWEEGVINEPFTKEEAIELLKKHRRGMRVEWLYDVVNDKKYEMG